MANREFRIALHPAQSAIFNSKARFTITAAGRRFGKSYLAAVKLGLEALKEVNDRGHKLDPTNGIYYIAPTFEQAMRIMWRRLIALLKMKDQGGFISAMNINNGYLELINGRRIYIKGADNEDALRGEGYAFVVMDEFADMKPSVWYEIIEPALMDVEGGAMFIGTPKGKNHFYKLFTGAMTKPDGHAYWNDWEAFHFVSSDNPFIKKRELDRIKSNPNATRDIIKQELEASFVSGGAKILRPEWFPVIPHERGDGENLKFRTRGSVYITVDLAGFTKEGTKILRSDESVIAVTDVTEDIWTIMEIDHGHWDVRETALRILTAVKKYPGCRLGIESGALANAVGPYLTDYMREFGRYITPEPLKHGNQRKADRIQWALQGRAERRQIRLMQGTWNDHFLDQAADFPDPLAHDDLLDAVAYVDQLSSANYSDPDDVPDWVPMDIDSGY